MRNREIQEERLSPDEVVAIEQADDQRAASLEQHCDHLTQYKHADPNCTHLIHCGAGQLGFVVGYDGTFRLWDLTSGRQVRSFRLPAHDGLQQREVASVAVSPDGSQALSAGGWQDAEGHWHTELLLWRLPDKLGYWLLDTQDAEAAK